MPNIQFQDAVSIADLTALKAISESDRTDKSIRVVIAPGNNLPPSWYQFDANSSLTEMLPGIVVPGEGTGRWIMMPSPIHVTNSAPNITPPLTRMQWINNNRIWESVGTSSINDWVELTVNEGGSGY